MTTISCEPLPWVSDSARNSASRMLPVASLASSSRRVCRNRAFSLLKNAATRGCRPAVMTAIWRPAGSSCSTCRACSLACSKRVLCPVRVCMLALTSSTTTTSRLGTAWPVSAGSASAAASRQTNRICSSSGRF